MRRYLLPALVLAILAALFVAAPAIRNAHADRFDRCGSVATHPYCHALALRKSIRALHTATVTIARAKYLPAERRHHLTWHVPKLAKEQRFWAARLKTARLADARVPYTSPRAWAWLCIYSHEAANAGGWAANTGNGYWGGLQMDLGFQRTYGPEFLRRWGTANNWPAWAQMQAADRAYAGYAGYGARGFSPWPNTAAMCGLR